MGLFDFFKKGNNQEQIKINLDDFKFVSASHSRFENGKKIGDASAGRGIRVQSNISGIKDAYTVTIYNMDGNHPVWGNNIQMSPKRMKIKSVGSNEIELIGFGNDEMGSPFSDYGLSLKLKDNTVYEIILHMHARNVKMIYQGSQEVIKAPNYMKFEPMKVLEAFEFEFHSSKFKVWEAGKIIDEGNELNIFTNRLNKNPERNMKTNLLTINNSNFKYLTNSVELDITMTGPDNIFLITLPKQYEPSGNTSIEMFKNTIGNSREKKTFQKYEPYVAKLFLTEETEILKLSFTLVHPKLLIEFE